MNKKKKDKIIGSANPTWLVVISAQAIAMLRDLTASGLYGDSVSTTATVLLLEKLREIKEKETK